MVAAGLVAALVVSAASVSESAAAPEPPPLWEAFIALSGGAQPEYGAFAGTGRIGLNRKVTSWLRPELQLFSGGSNGPNTFFNGIRLGTRLELPREGAIPYLWLGFAHAHETSFENARRAPVSVSLGLSEDGVIHRTGLDVGLGVAWEFSKVRPGTLPGRLGLRASMVSLLGSGAPRTFEALATFGVGF